jgi:heme exporter protein CcmD
MMEWLAMGGYGGYVWGAYAVVAAAVGVECWRLGARRRSALARARIEAGANGAG